MYHLADERPVVQKYGGTSVGTVERIQYVATRVVDQHQKPSRGFLSPDGRRLHKCWDESIIPVVAGVRSAVALAVAFDAAFCEISTDVDRIFTADPRLVPAAQLLEETDLEVALERASFGSKVLQTRCVGLGAKFQMPIVLRNSFKANDHQRTIITSFNAQREGLCSGAKFETERSLARDSAVGLDMQSHPGMDHRAFIEDGK